MKVQIGVVFQGKSIGDVKSAATVQISWNEDKNAINWDAHQGI